MNRDKTTDYSSPPSDRSDPFSEGIDQNLRIMLKINQLEQDSKSMGERIDKLQSNMENLTKEVNEIKLNLRSFLNATKIISYLFAICGGIAALLKIFSVF